jgi:hypothetical protein
VLAAQAEKPPVSSLVYRLLPDPLDEVEGNAAPMWNRAVMATRAVRHAWTEKQEAWSNADTTPLDKLPRKEVKAILDKHSGALRLAELAARRTRCDWELPAPTFQTLALDMPLYEVQGVRQVARLLYLRCRLELAERKFDAARKTMQTGFALARHVGKSTMVIQDLVAIAIALIMLECVQEWVQLPGSPNLYWALTELPRPFIDTRHSMESELNIPYRSFPALRDLKKSKVSAAEVRRLVDKVFAGFGEHAPAWVKKLGPTVMALRYYPQAKKELIASGRTEKEVKAMPTLQVVAIYQLEQYDRARDEILQWLAVPAWQGRAQLEKVEAKVMARAREDGNVLISLLMPAAVKVSGAQLRLERHIAGLRGAEALRAHVAATGKAPAKWSEITLVPGPIDPFTGQGFGAWYRPAGGKAILDVPAPPRMPTSIGRTYEMSVKGAGEKK